MPMSKGVKKNCKSLGTNSNPFKDYDDHLLFETMNEPREVGSPMEWMGGTYETEM